MSNPNQAPSPVAHEVQSRSAAEVFQSEAALHKQTEQALISGVIDIQVTEEGGTSTFVPVAAEDLRLQAGETRLPFSMKQDEIFSRTTTAARDKIHLTEAEKIKQQVLWQEEEKAWWLQEPGVGEFLKDDEVTQVDLLHIGETTIPLVNFSRTAIDSQVVERIAELVKLASDVTDGGAQRVLKAICIQNQERMSSEITLGSARVSSGVIRLSEAIFRESEFDELRKKQNKVAHAELPIDHYRDVTLLHEIGHLVQGNADNESFGNDKNYVKYGVATGWKEETQYVTDDYGTQTLRGQQRVGLPSFVASQKNEDGVYEEVSLKDIATIDEILAAAPVSKYAETNSREDFAEAFPIYVYQPNRLNAVRRHAIKNMLNQQVMSGPVGEASTESVDLQEFDFQVPVVPRTLDISLKYSVQTGALTAPIDRAQSKPMRSGSNKEIVDDYGNEVKARPEATVW